MVEYADVTVFDDEVDAAALGLVTALARPGSTVAEGSHDLAGAALVGHLHQHTRTHAWTNPTRTDALPEVRHEGVWRVDLQSLQPFHPERLLESLDRLGTGAHRSRGCFWLPTRPGRALAWDGAGGQLSKIRCRSSAKPARPYIFRFRRLNVVLVPSMGPLL